MNINTYVITITGLPESVEIANRCIDSIYDHDIDFDYITKFDAITPANNPERIMEKEGIDYSKFKGNIYSRYLNSLSCFLSHYFLWEECVLTNEPTFILEHDAVFINTFDKKLLEGETGLVSFGHPSYGRFNVPKTNGLNPLTSKKYLPGAHAYMVFPKFAKLAISKAKTHAYPTDVFLSNENFPGLLKEFYPWIAVVKETFTTVQNIKGCDAKHGYQCSKDSYDLKNPNE